METNSSTPEPIPPLVAIVGRPNVGKSALFNRLLGRRKALVDSTPGLTRDRLYGEVRWRGFPFRIVDTGGLLFSGRDQIQRAIASQVQRAMEEACLALLVCDAREGPMPLDRQAASWLRGWGKPVLLVANKVDEAKDRLGVHEFSALGLGSPWAVSSLHGVGVGELLDAVVEKLRAAGLKTVPGTVPERYQGPKLKVIRMAVVGRPNVGKSSLINRILNEERVLVDETPGTTRDPVEVLFSYRGNSYCLVDTAGIRARGKLATRMEAVARLKSLEAIRRSDACVGILEAPVGLVRDDLRLLDEVLRAGRPLCLVLNKWDRVPAAAQSLTTQELARQIARRAPFLRIAPVVCTSAKSGYHVLQVLDRVAQLWANAQRRLEPDQMRQLVGELRQDPRSPPAFRRAPWMRLAQVGVAPPLFQLGVSSPGRFRTSDLSFVEAALRRVGGFDGVPVRVRLVSRRR